MFFSQQTIQSHNEITVQRDPFLNICVSIVFLRKGKEVSVVILLFTFFLSQEKEHCIPNPCKNGGSCSAEEKGFTCLCQPSFRGEICQSKNFSSHYLLTFLSHIFLYSFYLHYRFKGLRCGEFYNNYLRSKLY